MVAGTNTRSRAVSGHLAYRLTWEIDGFRYSTWRLLPGQADAFVQEMAGRGIKVSVSHVHLPPSTTVPGDPDGEQGE